MTLYDVPDGQSYLPEILSPAGMDVSVALSGSGRYFLERLEGDGWRVVGTGPVGGAIGIPGSEAVSRVRVRIESIRPQVIGVTVL